MASGNDLLAASPVQSTADAAVILRLLRKNGEPNRAEVRRLVREGKLRLVDPTQPPHRWTIASVELVRYIGANLEQDVAS